MKINRVLIFYPDEFNVQAKFNRKLLKILQGMSQIELQFIRDEQKLIHDFSTNECTNTSLKQLKDFQESDCSHAIFFDDGEVFVEELKILKSKEIPTRLIKVSITRVVNIQRQKEFADKTSSSTYEYIGRGSYWGNPYSMHEQGEDREEVIRKYEYDFKFDKFPNKEIKRVHELTGKRLGCFCKPYPCHGDVLADYLNSYDDGS